MSGHRQPPARLAAGTAGVCLMLLLAFLATASAKTVSRNGIVVSMPASGTVHGSGKDTVAVSARVAAGVRKKIVSAEIKAYVGREQVAAGRRIRLAAGTYYLVTTVSWRAIKTSPTSGKRASHGTTHTYVTGRQKLVVTRVAPAPTTHPAQPTSCTPLTDGGNCYEPGEYCRDDDHGATGVADDGESIRCEDNDGWRWEPAH